MTPYEYLISFKHGLPDWLKNYQAGEKFNRQHFFASRVVFYPGSGFDGQPVKLFASTHSAHCFVYVDYGLDRQTIEAELSSERYRFQGYHTLSRIELAESDITPTGWHPHITEAEARATTRAHIDTAPFGFVEILERNTEFDDNHGPERLAILFLGADGIAAYDALFCQKSSVKPPFAVVLQDHGFGGNYDHFGNNGLLHRIAGRCQVFPEILLVAENTTPWENYHSIPDVAPDRGGMHNTRRNLYKRGNS